MLSLAILQYKIRERLAQARVRPEPNLKIEARRASVWALFESDSNLNSKFKFDL
jgi:hypothetical protein